MNSESTLFMLHSNPYCILVERSDAAE